VGDAVVADTMAALSGDESCFPPTAKEGHVAVKISVVGAGYLGVVHAACMARQGHDVVTVDRDLGKVDLLKRGVAPFFEPGLSELLDEVIPTGRLRFTSEFVDVADADVHFVCVGTPQSQTSGAADTRYVFDAARSLAPHLKPGAIIVGKSTVPVGTAAAMRATMQSHAGPGVHVRLVWNPEFLREGFAIQDTLTPDRFVYGVDGPFASADVQVLDQVYAQALATGTPRLVMDYPTAEMVKTAANAFLATKISFINAMAEICEVVGADVTALAEAIGHDERIGRKFLGAGVGFGGGCLPKDIRAFVARADELGVGHALDFLREVDAINLRRRDRVVALAERACGGSLDGARVALLGAAFKPNSDDVRDSPALAVAAAIHRAEAQVTVYDPKAMANAKQYYPQLNYCDSLLDACAGADVVLVLTEWAEFRRMDPRELGAIVRQRQVIDGRNALDAHRWAANGWDYQALGQPARSAEVEYAPVG
jgi:UDPglucose 6-dehydrogenase